MYNLMQLKPACSCLLRDFQNLLVQEFLTMGAAMLLGEIPVSQWSVTCDYFSYINSQCNHLLQTEAERLGRLSSGFLST